MFGKKHACGMCGQALAAHDRDVRFRLPDPVLESPEQHQVEDSWLSDPDPNKATLMQIPNISPFVRALLPIKLQGGHEFRFGVWIAIHPDDLQHACRVWNAPQYADLKVLAVAAVVVAFAISTPEGSWSSPWVHAGGAATAGLMITYWAWSLPRRSRRPQLNNGAIV